MVQFKKQISFFFSSLVILSSVSFRLNVLNILYHVISDVRHNDASYPPVKITSGHFFLLNPLIFLFFDT